MIWMNENLHEHLCIELISAFLTVHPKETVYYLPQLFSQAEAFIYLIILLHHHHHPELLEMGREKLKVRYYRQHQHPANAFSESHWKITYHLEWLRARKQQNQITQD